MLTSEDKTIITELEIPQLHTSKLEISQKIGTGGFGKVMKGKYQNIPVAIKKLLKFDLKNFLREIRVLKKVKHPHVPLLIGINMNGFDNDTVCVVSELVDGPTLDKYVKAKKPSTVLLLLHMIDLASVLSYCHGINLIHRDLKPENVMINKKMDVKLLDFGISKFSVHSNTKTELIGSISYMAPECFEVTEECDDNGSQPSKIGKKVDVWAFGLILYSLFTDEKPYKFFGSDGKIQAFLIMKKDYPIDKNKIQNGKIALVCEQCTKANPQDRPDMEVVKRKLISALYDEIKNIYVDVNDLIGPVEDFERFHILKKLENYLKEYLKIVPEIQIKAKNKMEVILKEDNIYLSLKKKIAKKIKHNLDLVEEKALSKNQSLNKLRISTHKSERQKEEEERKKKFNFKMNQIAEEVSSSSSSSSSDEDSDSEDSESEEEIMKVNIKGITDRNYKSTGVNSVRSSFGNQINVRSDGMFEQIEEMFGYKK